MGRTTERRRFPRYALPAMYTPVAVRLPSEAEFTDHGHAYDISVGGLRFEMDRLLEPGTTVVLQISLPAAEGHNRPETVLATARIVWLQDEDEPGPVRMAAVFTGFEHPEDADRLQRRLHTGRFLHAA